MYTLCNDIFFLCFPVSLNCKQYNKSQKGGILTMTAHTIYINSLPSWWIVPLLSQMSLNAEPEQVDIFLEL